jgi:hypothetical protein
MAVWAVLLVAGLTACGGSGGAAESRSDRRASEVGDVEICVDASSRLAYSVRFNKNDAGGVGPFRLLGDDEYSCAVAPATSPGSDDNMGFEAALIATVVDAGGTPVFESRAWNFVVDYPRNEVRTFPEYVGKRWAFAVGDTQTWAPTGRPFKVVVTRDDDGADNLKHFVVSLRSIG